MEQDLKPRFISFNGVNKIAVGELPEVVSASKMAMIESDASQILIFDFENCKTVEIDWRGNHAEVLNRIETSVPPTPSEVGISRVEPLNVKPGRPRLGVIAREITLLPRHWDWLNSQPGGASVAIRKLVEEARRVNADEDRRREARESCYRFVSVIAGDMPGFEEASRAIFAGDTGKFTDEVENWPNDIRDYAVELMQRTV